jgi:Spherulation-specific family 4
MVFAVAGTVVALAGVLSALTLRPGGGPEQRTCTSLAVPAYYPPSPAVWSRLTSPPSVSLVVGNIENGPGASADPAYRAVLRQALRTPVRVLGYVSTGYGRRADAAVRADIDHWSAFYGVTGIFLDEVPSDPANVARYRGYAEQVRARHGMVALNPGVVPDPGYLRIADVVVTFEGPYQRYTAASLAAPSGGATAWHIVYDVPAADAEQVVQRAAQHGAGLVYVTGAPAPNPFAALPTYWPKLAQTAHERCRL